MSSGNKYKVIASKIKFEGRAFINGKYVNAIDGKKDLCLVYKKITRCWIQRS